MARCSIYQPQHIYRPPSGFRPGLQSFELCRQLGALLARADRALQVGCGGEKWGEHRERCRKVSCRGSTQGQPGPSAATVPPLSHPPGAGLGLDSERGAEDAVRLEPPVPAAHVRPRAARPGGDPGPGRVSGCAAPLAHHRSPRSALCMVATTWAPVEAGRACMWRSVRQAAASARVVSGPHGR